MKNMTSIFWKIEKKLLEAGGLGPVVYIIPARGSGKLSAERERVEKFLAKGRKVVYGRPDYDMLTPKQYERADRILNHILKGE
jgi:hypothetical protein